MALFKLRLFVIAATLLQSLVVYGSPKCKPLFDDLDESIVRSPDYTLKALEDRSNFVVVTWNLQNFFVSRPRPYQMSTYQRRPSEDVFPKEEWKVEQIKSTLQKLSADVNVLQEVVGSKSTLVLDPKNEYFHLTNTPADSGGKQTVFMVRKSLNVAAKVYNLKNIGPREAPRGFPILSLRKKNHKGKIINPKKPDMVVIGIHLKARTMNLSEPIFLKNKARELKLLVQTYQQVRAMFGDVPVMLAGDFNIGSNHPIMGYLKEHFAETIKEARPNVPREYRITQVSFTHQGRETSQMDASFVNPILNDRLVDSFASHMGLNDLLPHSYEARQATRASDHNPVVTILNMKQP